MNSHLDLQQVHTLAVAILVGVLILYEIRPKIKAARQSRKI